MLHVQQHKSLVASTTSYTDALNVHPPPYAYKGYPPVALAYPTRTSSATVSAKQISNRIAGNLGATRSEHRSQGIEEIHLSIMRSKLVNVVACMNSTKAGRVLCCFLAAADSGTQRIAAVNTA